MAFEIRRRRGAASEPMPVADDEGEDDGASAPEQLFSAEPTMMGAEARTLLLSGDKDAGLTSYKKRMYRKMDADDDDRVCCIFLICFVASLWSGSVLHVCWISIVPCCVHVPAQIVYVSGWKTVRFRIFSPGAQDGTVVQVRTVVEWYMEGLHWVMQYYYRGVPSWSWYYPFHYAPFLSDMKKLQAIVCEFTQGEPVKPYQQVCHLPPWYFITCARAYFNEITNIKVHV